MREHSSFASVSYFVDAAVGAVGILGRWEDGVEL